MDPVRKDLTCAVCLTIFTDPVILLCGHSFCRECVKLSLKSLNQCPQCPTIIPTDRMDFTTNHILKSLAEKIILLIPKVGFCPEHDEKLKLFCLTDQQLTCIICRDCERHEGHKFKPVKEAAASLRKETETLLEKDSTYISTIELSAKSQNEEIRKSKEKSKQLRSQISSQFQEMHQFLKRRKDEIMNELKCKENDEIKKMRERLNVIEKVLSEGKEFVGKIKSAVEITDPESFLKSWSEYKTMRTPGPSSNCMVNSSLSLGPYESHLQFFLWKEMLQVIQPRAELLTFQSKSFGFSADLNFNPNQAKATVDLQTACSVKKFGAGQYYWEIEVGSRDYWELGIIHNFLKYDGVQYATCGPNITKELQFESRPRKIGVYFDSSSKQLSFYDADAMKKIHSVSAVFVSTPVSAQINIKYKQPDHSPVTVCWY
uniref:Uncharacterized protein n=1 Tax=Fundulus heteroclitus TaxID=8078 RepID=A0A3Q2QWW2_FUNHE